MINISRRQWAFSAASALLLAGAAFGQATGALMGTVEDASGKLLGGADVRVFLKDTPVASTFTSPFGAFLFPALRPGIYRLVVEAPNHDRITQNVRIDPAAETDVGPLRLEPAGFAPVAASTNPRERPLETLNTDLAFTATGEQIADSPLLARDPFALALTLPGVTVNGRSGTAIYGEPIDASDITYDGIDVPDSFIPDRGVNSTSLRLRSDQVAEVTIVTGSMYGCGCAQIAMSSPAGGARLDGSAYWLYLPPALSAQRWMDNSANTPATTSLNQLGASLGGPLVKHRLFFFLNAEGDLDRSTVTRTGQTFSSPLTSQDPILQSVLNMMPISSSGQYRGTQDNWQTGGIGLARLDYLPSLRHTLGLTFSAQEAAVDDPSDSGAFSRRPDTTFDLSSQFLAGTWRWSLTPHLTNELRAGGNRSAIDFRNSLRSQFGFIAVLDDPSMKVSQPMLGMDPRGMDDRRASFEDTLTWVKGRFTWTAGFRIEHYELGSYGVNNGLLDSLTVPRYIVANLARGDVGQVDQRFNIVSASSGYTSGATAQSKLASNLWSPYIHGTWRALRSLTFTAGVRHDYLSPPNDSTGTAIIPYLTSPLYSTPYDQNMPFMVESSQHPFYHPDQDGYGLDGGLAWKPFARLPIVFRGAASASYLYQDQLPDLNIYALQNPFQSFDVTTRLGRGVPLSKVPVTPTPVEPELTLPALLAFANSYGQEPGTVYGVNPDMATPNLKYWNAGLEAEAKGLHIDVRYVGNRLEEGWRSADRNPVMMPPQFFISDFNRVRAALLSGSPTSGFPGIPGGGLCSNFSLQSCQTDTYAVSLIETGQAAELLRWYQGQGYNPGAAYNYGFMANPNAPQGVDVLSHLGASRYDGLELTFSRRTGRLSLSTSYVFSKVTSNLDEHEPGAVDPYLDLFIPSLEWSPSPFNLAQAWKILTAYELPSPRAAGSASVMWRRLFGGWTISGISIAQTGAPFSLLSGGYVVKPNGQTEMVTGLGTFNSLADAGQNPVYTTLTAPQIESYFGLRKNPNGTVSFVNAPADAFQEPAPGTFGNLPRRAFTGAGAFNLDLGLRKSILISERVRGELRGEVINVLNNVNWLVGDQTFLGPNTQNNTATFNNNVTQWNLPRNVQFSLRVLF